jgi:hypothetical protein
MGNNVPIGKSIKIGLSVLAIILVISVTGSWLGVFGKALSAPARVISKTLDTDNILHNYELFFDLNAGYISRTGQIDSYKTLMAGETDKGEQRKLRIEMVAMQQTCRSLVVKYNANAEKLNRKLFKANSLPEQLQIANCE